MRIMSDEMLNPKSRYDILNREDLSVNGGVKDLAKTGYGKYFVVTTTGNWDRAFMQRAAALYHASLSTSLVYEASTNRIFEVHQKRFSR